IFHADNTDNAFVWSNIINTPEVHYAPVEDNSLFKNQENHSVVHSSFDMEQRIPLSSNQHAKIFASDDVSNPKNEVVANIMTENDDELEDGEVLSDEETSSDSNKKAALRKVRDCSEVVLLVYGIFTLPTRVSRASNRTNMQVAEIYNQQNVFTDNAYDDLSLASMPKNLGNSENSAGENNKVRKERKLNILELQLRARAIEALIRRSDDKS
ncbi:unnamed protein product, partial [Onchocerca flexuosa]|uniref:BHLH domain-containing protein n=2 Tax=Onchocerca flexuosa TaxID=387005 RepID=A0A183H5I3_9BILA